MPEVKETAELKALVESEVRRQLGEVRKEIDQAIAEVRERTVDDRATLVVFSEIGQGDPRWSSPPGRRRGLETRCSHVLGLPSRKGAGRPKHGKEDVHALTLGRSPSESPR
jgi:hypothetical protein